MATFREIDEAIMALIDEESGELLDVEAFQALQMERTEKAQNMALWALDLREEQELIKGEIRRLQGRMKAAERKEEQLRQYLAAVLGGEKLKTPRVTVSYRSSQAVEVTDEETLRRWAQTDPVGEDVLRYKEPEISKSEVRRLILEGRQVPGAELVDRVNTVIK